MSLTAVQTQFFDASNPLFAGQLADWAVQANPLGVNTYRTESLLIAGRGVVKGTNNAQGDPILTPYGVKAPLAGSVDADFVGIAVLSQALNTDANNNAVTLRATTVHAICERSSISGEKNRIGARAWAAVAHGDPVYMSVSDATIPVGEFTNAAGTGRILIANATWYGPAASGTIGRIQL